MRVCQTAVRGSATSPETTSKARPTVAVAVEAGDQDRGDVGPRDLAALDRLADLDPAASARSSVSIPGRTIV